MLQVEVDARAPLTKKEAEIEALGDNATGPQKLMRRLYSQVRNR
jgi:hypothetical protein